MTLTYTTFIPMATLTDPMGRTYTGDNRTFNQPGTYRTTQTVTINTVNNTIAGSSSNTGVSHQIDPATGNVLRSAQASPTAGFSVTASPYARDGTRVFTISGSSTNPLATVGPINYAPSIDYSMTVVSSPNGTVTVYVHNDGFPAHQLDVNGSTVYTFDPRSVGNGPTSLFPVVGDQSPAPIVIPPKK